MPNIFEQIEQDYHAAMKSGNALTRDTLRMVKTALVNRKIEKGTELTEEEALAVLRKEAKSRQESVNEFQRAGRTEMAEKESSEKGIIEKYLPAEMSDEDLAKVVDQAISTTGAQGAVDMGKVMREVMVKVAGKAGGDRVAQIVRQKLS